jgi:hypothetical protein
MAVEVTDACRQCNRTSHWPLEVYEATGGVCARCLEERPGLLLQLVAAEGHPHRTAPMVERATRWGVQHPDSAWKILGAFVVGLLATVLVAPTRNACLAHGGLLVLWALLYVRRVP